MTPTKSLLEKIRQEETDATERDMKLLESCIKDTKDYIIELITQNRYREGSKARFAFPKDVFLSKLEGVEPEVVTISAFRDCVKALVASELSGEGIHYHKGFNLPRFTSICSHFDESVVEGDYYIFGLEFQIGTEALVCATLTYYNLHKKYYGHNILPFLYYDGWEIVHMRDNLTESISKIRETIFKLDKSYVKDTYINNVRGVYLENKVGFEKDRENKRKRRLDVAAKKRLSKQDTETVSYEPESGKLEVQTTNPELDFNTTSPMTWIALTVCVSLGLGLFASLISS